VETLFLPIDPPPIPSHRVFCHTPSFLLLTHGGSEPHIFAVQAMLKYEPESGEVQLVVDRSYREGEPITAWFGPQPNHRVRINDRVMQSPSRQPCEALRLQYYVYKFSLHIHSHTQFELDVKGMRVGKNTR